MAVLEIKNFSKIYSGGKCAVDSINVTVEPGDLYGFIGPNGAGKTSTIRSAVGVLAFEEGDILINGISIKESPVMCKSELAYIPDNPSIYEFMSGIQYLNYMCDLFKVEYADRKQRITKYADIFSMKEKLGGLISSYSHGMRQKLAIMGALVHNPKLLVLDEPLVGLDPRTVVVLRNILKEFCSEGNAVFFSSHVLDVVEKLCNKVSIINKGRIVKSGETKELMRDTDLESIFLELTE